MVPELSSLLLKSLSFSEAFLPGGTAALCPFMRLNLTGHPCRCAEKAFASSLQIQPLS